MRTTDAQPLAILVGDIHLQHTCPPARSAEPSWYGAMQRRLEELRALSEQHAAPVVYAGDIFDRYNPPPELINFALKYLPPGYAVPGQHDLPNHNLSELNKTAFGVLVAAGVLTMLDATDADRPGPVTRKCDTKNLCLWGYPWGRPLQPLPTHWRGDEYIVHLAVVHAYIWQAGSGYPGAPEDRRLAAYSKVLDGYHAAVFGDNHKGFLAYNMGRHKWRTAVLNCGSFIPRKADELGYAACYGLLLSDGSIRREPFDDSDDRWSDKADAAASAYEQTADFTAYLDELRALSSDDMDFAELCRRYVNEHDVNQTAADLVLEAINNNR